MHLIPVVIVEMINISFGIRKYGNVSNVRSVGSQLLFLRSFFQRLGSDRSVRSAKGRRQEGSARIIWHLSGAFFGSLGRAESCRVACGWAVSRGRTCAKHHTRTFVAVLVAHATTVHRRKTTTNTTPVIYDFRQITSSDQSVALRLIILNLTIPPCPGRDQYCSATFPPLVQANYFS